MLFPAYPVTEVLPRLCEVLGKHTAAILKAPAGSGKTTLVPLALLNEPWMAGRKILLLEPRRMAARAAAWRMAELLGEQPGETVGYQVRMERCATSKTRILVLTEGLLTRRLLDDPELADVGAILFDEFHERSLQADFGLALALDVRRALRPDLRLLIMSATLHIPDVSRFLGEGTPIVEASGRLYPVETIFLPLRTRFPRLAEQVAAGIRRACAEHDGSILAFLPGEGEIRACAEILSAPHSLPDGVDLRPLYAALPRARQDEALRPCADGRRKVVLATSIAESSLTIEGISCVVDSGFARVSRFSPATGMSHLETIRISRDRADQRTGRAGRLGNGFCYRLWSEEEDRRLSPVAQPEILSADLADLVLACADWGDSSGKSLPWPTMPPQMAWNQATELLRLLGALDESGSVTPHGHALLRFGMHPRLSHTILSASAQGDGSLHTACLLAAALSEGAGAGLRGSTNAEVLLLELEEGGRDIPPAVRARVRELARLWEQTAARIRTPVAHRENRRCGAGELLAYAYPDRIARRRGLARDQGRYQLFGGRGAKLPPNDGLAQSEWIVVAEIEDSDADGTVRLAAGISAESVLRLYGDSFTKKEVLMWNPRLLRVDVVERECLGAITVRERPLKDPDFEQVLSCLCQGIRTEGIRRLQWSRGACELQARALFLRKWLPEEEIQDLTDEALAADLENWLGSYLYGCTTLAQAAEIDLLPALTARLGAVYPHFDEWAPTHLTVPSGSRIRIDYSSEQPSASVRIQETFGMRETPRVARGKVPVLLQLLSPAQRPVQITSDLASFWREGYQAVRKELRGRYPRHEWPEDPTFAQATRRAKPRGPR